MALEDMVNGLPDRPSVTQVVDAFAAGTGLIVESAVAAQLADEVLDGQIVELLDHLRPQELSWWLLVVRAWQHAGANEVAAVSAHRAAALIRGGMAASWSELNELTDLLHNLPLPPGAVDTSAQSTSAHRALEPQSAEFKAHRLTRHLANNPRRAASDDLTQFVERALMNATSVEDMRLEEQWFELREYRLLVEQFLLRLGDRPVSSWIENERAGLTLCGRALLRCGDRTSAYACFYLVMSHHDITDYGAGQDDDIIRVASSYLDQLRDEKPQLGRTSDPLWLYIGGLQLTRWLVDHRLEGFFDRFATWFADKGTRRSGVLARDRHMLALRCGWMELDVESSAPDTDTGLSHHQPAPLAVTPKNLLGGRCPTAPMSLSALARPSLTFIPSTPAPGPAGSVRVPIGLAEGGGAAELLIHPGARIRILGPPARAALLASIADSLTAAGWAVIWIRNEAGHSRLDAGLPGWDRMHHSDSALDDQPWEQILNRSASLRVVLAERLGRLPAPDGPWQDMAVRCARAVADCFDPHSWAPAFPEDGAASANAAARLVDNVARIRLQQPVDIQTYAVLVDHVLYAIRVTRKAISTIYTAAGPRPDKTFGPRVLLDLPDGLDDDIDVATALLLSSLAGVVGTVADRAERGQSPGIPGSLTVDTDDFDLVVSPRTEVLELDELIELARQAEPATASDEGSDSKAWEPLRGALAGRDVCFLISGALPPARRAAFDRIIGSTVPLSALVYATDAPSVDDIRYSDDYDQYVVGDLAPEVRELLPFSAGAELNVVGSIAITYREAAIWVSARPGYPPQRLVAWPETGESGVHGST